MKWCQSQPSSLCWSTQTIAIPRPKHECCKTGRTFSGRVLQLITGSTGLDDWEWGVTLFATHPDDLKEVVYTMRFDEASAQYAEFGPFYTGMVCGIDDLLSQLLPG